MSEKTGISNSENIIENSRDEILNFQGVLTCGCENLHEFSISFEKEYIISFSCTDKDIKLSELNKSNALDKKCDICKNEIIKDTDFCNINEDNTQFVCVNCKKSNDNLSLTRISEIIQKEKNKSEENFRKTLVKKIDDFINNNGILKENEFYNKCLADIQLLKKFVLYLCFLRKLYAKKNNAYKIISNFLDYFEHLIDIAFTNIQLYDLYHFNKEAIIYSFGYDTGKTFLSKEFEDDYEELLNMCEKEKYLSLQMLKYIYEKYAEKGLSNKIAKKLMKVKYFKKEKINSSEKILSVASKISIKYLGIKKDLAELTNKLSAIELKTKFTKLEEELYLDKYIDSFLKMPGIFSSLRKCSSVILDKLIKKNYNKLEFIQPNERIINLTLSLISRMYKTLKKSNEKKIASSIWTKLNNLENTLQKYQNYISKKHTDDSIKELKPPLINLKDEEKELLSIEMNDENYKNNFNKIRIINEKDENLDFIINYFFELKDLSSRAIHIDDKEYLKFYSFPKKMEGLPKKGEDDNFQDAIKKIKGIIEMIPKLGEVSYDKLINFIFEQGEKNFLENNKKIDSLLTFLNIKLSKLDSIKEEYKNKKNEIDDEQAKIIRKIDNINSKNYEIKYDNFIKKYSIKVNSKEIFSYLDNLVQYVFPRMNDSKNSNLNEEFENENEIDSIDESEKLKKNEEKLRKELNDLFEKDAKFVNYIDKYLLRKLQIYLEENKSKILKYLKSIKDKINNQNLLFLKLQEIKKIISTYELYNFDIKANFKEFADKYEFKLPKKKQKVEDNKSNVKDITNIEIFIKSLKNYLGDLNEKVELLDEEPGQFIFQLFLKKIGLSWS